MKVQVRKEKKSWTHEGPRKKWKKIAMSTKESRERERGSCKMELQQIRW
jgi:hypothetical protein